MFTVWFAYVGGVAVTGQKKELNQLVIYEQEGLGPPCGPAVNPSPYGRDDWGMADCEHHTIHQ